MFEGLDHNRQKNHTVRDKLLESGGLSVDRLPLLHVIFDRMATSCTEYVRHRAASPMYYSLDGIVSDKIGNLLEKYESNAIAAIFDAPEWDNHILIGFDRNFVYAMIEVLYGADGTEPPMGEGRAFSSIEMRVAQSLFEQTAKALQASFSIVSHVRFNLERLETRMDFAIIGRRHNQAIAAKFSVQALNQQGEMFVIVPQAAINPMRKALSSAISGESTGRDPRWAKQLKSEVRRTTVNLTAILEERSITLGELAELKVGQIIELQATPRSKIKLEGNQQALFWCTLGQSDGSFVLKVEDEVDRKEEFLDDILPR